jgi:hypothetical protein
MLRADSVPRTEDAALEQAEGGFDGVGMNVAVHVHTRAMPDSLVLRPDPDALRCASIQVEIVGKENIHVIANILSNVLLKCARLYVTGMEEAEFSLSLTDADHNLLVPGSAAALPVRSTTYVSFVHFHHTAEFWPVCFRHRGAYPVAKVPSGLVGLDSEGTLNLAGRHTLLSLTEKERGKKPRHERQVRIVEDRVHRNAELVFT